MTHGFRLSRQAELDRDLVLKLNRAKAHLENLRISIDEWREKRLYQFVPHAEHDRDDIWVSYWDAIQLEPFPECWVLWAGEFLYQCHSALDHLAWELANTRATADPDRVTFPIYRSRAKFWAPGDRRKGERFRTGSGGWRLQRIFGPARLPILEVQPYQRRNQAASHPLWHLFVLSNHDKHRALHVAGSALKDQIFENLEPQDLDFLGSGICEHKPFDKYGRRILWHRVRLTGPKPKLRGETKFEVEPVFGEGSPKVLVGQPFFDTLKAIYNYIVVDVIQRRFNPLFP